MDNDHNELRERAKAILLMLLVPFNLYGQWVALGFFATLVVLCAIGLVL